VRSTDEHLALLLRLVQPVKRESVPLSQALGLVAAEDIVATHPIPPFDNSAMDGYAVRLADIAAATEAEPVTLRVVGESSAGHPSDVAMASATTVRIMTGAPVPDGTEAVVPQEHVSLAGDWVTFARPAKRGAHIRRAGEDAVPGDVLVPAGTELRPRHLAAAASAGIAGAVVTPAPRVAFLVTGDELARPGEPLAPGQIHESNATTLAASLTALGAAPVDLGIVGDDPEHVLEAVKRAARERVAFIVTTGGASVGDHDAVKAALSPEGLEFTNVAMQPGKPQGLGLVDRTPVVCLPGNPVAVAVCVEMFVAPAVRALRGVAEPSWETVTAGAAWTSPPGREQFMPAVMEGGLVRPATAGGSGSHLIARLAAAHGLVRVPAASDAVRPGDTLAFRRFTT
jgi:molybdopterin molybdotransferase